jgi:DNA-binding response OmpR family regulator
MAKILLVGQDPSVQQMYSDILSAGGYDVVVEENAKEALDRLIEEFFPGCVVFLPREEALWFIIKVRSVSRVRVSSVPILAVVEEEDVSNEFIETGATKVISKFPVSGDRLVAELRSILNIPRLGLV